MQKPQLVAVDTNVLMRLAERHEATVDAWHLIRRRIQSVQFIALPTVLDELAYNKIGGQDAHVRWAAYNALVELRGRWRFLPLDLNAVQEAILKNAAGRLLDSGLIPRAERNDAAIVAEAAILNAILLVSRDSHLLDIDREKLALLFRQLDLMAPVIASPEALVKKFYT